MTDYSDIIKRLEKANGPSRELDNFITNACYKMPSLVHGAKANWTESLDASVSLVRRMLPGAVWYVMTDYGGLNRAKVGPKENPSASIYTDEDAPLFMVADANTPVLALLLAMFRTLSAQEGE